MASLRSRNYFTGPTTVRALARLAGLSGQVSLRELITLLGPATFGPRPFYIFSHNPNSIAEVNDALAAGANAIEPDVNVYKGHEDQLCVSHSEGDANAPSLSQFLRELHGVAINRPELALVVFDCKEKVATPQHGSTLLNSVRQLLTFDTGLNVIISVSSLSMRTIFEQISAGLGPREGCMIDEENDPNAVASFFAGKGITRDCYGYGSSFFEESDATYRTPLESACWMRAAHGSFRFIYAWTVNDQADQREYLRIGVDGIIADNHSIPQLRGVLVEPEFQGKVRLATRTDNPFLPPNSLYGLTVKTGDISMASTDANVTFTLTGSAGSASIMVDTSLTARMGQNETNYVTVQGPDLGKLQSISVQRDNRGNAPDWYLNSIAIESYRYKISAQALFYRWIDSTVPFTVLLTH
jgi:PLAT/LH2 domain